jgi:hypothetical protein
MAQFLNGIKPKADIERNSTGFLNGRKRNYFFFIESFKYSWLDLGQVIKAGIDFKGFKLVQENDDIIPEG